MTQREEHADALQQGHAPKQQKSFARAKTGGLRKIQQAAGQQRFAGAETVVNAAADGRKHSTDDAARQQETEAEADELEKQKSRGSEREMMVMENRDVEQRMLAALEQAMFLPAETEEHGAGEKQQGEK